MFLCSLLPSVAKLVAFICNPYLPARQSYCFVLLKYYSCII